MERKRKIKCQLIGHMTGQSDDHLKIGSFYLRGIIFAKYQPQ
jgi:hypothetical protein